MIPLLEMLEEELKAKIEEVVQDDLDRLKSKIERQFSPKVLTPEEAEMVKTLVEGHRHTYTVRARNRALANFIETALKPDPFL